MALYKKEYLSQISFPLGGIGSGSIGLAGNGRLLDWEIFNRPARGSMNGFSHFAVKAEARGKVLDARVLNSDLSAPYQGEGSTNFQGIGFGPARMTMAGLPHFEELIFNGEYPFATLEYFGSKFPGKLKLTAFNPLIPSNSKDSSIPSAFFEFEITNNTGNTISYTIAGTIKNPQSKYGAAQNRFSKTNGFSTVTTGSNGLKKTDVNFGELCIASDAKKVSRQEYWYRGTWFDNLTIFWKDFSSFGPLKNRIYPVEKKCKAEDHATLAGKVSIKSGEKKTIKFIISWNYPNRENYWDKPDCACKGNCKPAKPIIWKNYYASIFKDAKASALYSLKEWKRLSGQTKIYKEALFSSTLPGPVLDAVSANISILKSATCLRLPDGSFYSFEGCHASEGCCEGSCTHVWNYAYAIPFLFPGLERSMRDLNFKYNQREDGGLVFRIKLPLGSKRGLFRPCADGQFGDVIKIYRDWKISGDDKWLKGHWPAIKKAIEFAWAKTNEDKWDEDKDGILEGRQHHTLDMELFGPNSWLSGFYLAALKAGSEMAAYFGDYRAAAEYLGLFEKGRAYADKYLFNGEYYQQNINLNDRKILDKFSGKEKTLIGTGTLKAYWDDEHKEIKYQIGEGCGIDQVAAEWHANLCGLGSIFDKEQVKKALASIYKYNFKKSMRDFVNPCRLYCLNDEAGTVIAEYPKGKRKPFVPAPYAEETFHGCEYAVASHMIQEGLVKEGLEITKALRDRYDGKKRNPWNEFECGSNYARSMASYSLLPALSGFEYDMRNGMLGFAPKIKVKGCFKCFWSVEGAWGTVKIKKSAAELTVLGGKLELKLLRLGRLKQKEVTVAEGKKRYKVSNRDGLIFKKPVIINAGENIKIFS